MASLYQISNELFSIFNEIEDRGGEATDEQYDLLSIKQKELKDKLDDYVKAVKEFQADADFCKREKQSINEKQNMYKNRVERLKKAMLDAVLSFGSNGKNNKFVELPTCRVFTKSKKSVKTDDDRIIVLVNMLNGYIKAVHSAGMLSTGMPIEPEAVLEYVNGETRNRYGENFKPFTVEDLIGLKVNIVTKGRVADLFRNRTSLLADYADNLDKSCIETAMSVQDWQEAFVCGYGENRVTLAEETVDQYLMIK